MTLRLRSIFVCGGLLLLASTSFAQGEYQQAKDGKTLLWNDTPRPGETATWDGDRDKENYATGFGALTWYTAKGTVHDLYYGNMVHGKLEGPVNVHINGRTAHAYFADGGRVTGWGRGRAPSKMAVPEEAIVEKRKTQAEKEAAATKRAAAAAEAEKKKKSEAEKARPIEPVAAKQETKPEKPEVSSSEKPTSEIPPAITAKKSEAPATASPVRVFDEPTPIPVKPEIANQKPEPTQFPTAEPSATAAAVSGPPREEVATEPKPEVASGTSEISRESSSASTKKESPRDVSLNALTGPPSSLHTTTETSTPKMETETSTSRDNAPLTESEAISLADTEARVQGYHLDDYQRPKVDHSEVKGKWSLFYGSKGQSNAGENDGPLTVTVEDKTKKVEIRK
ncbi:MAG: hypothetical protein QOJ36_1115 [Verrucomicrobiota bacterium]